jgi:hypothetical protein
MKTMLLVSLKSDGQGKYLDVDNRKVQMIRNNDNPEWIIWTLDQDLKNQGGLFNKQTDPHQPFVWNIPLPPEGVFDAPYLDAKRLVLRLTDANPDENPHAGWNYRLYVSIGSDEYHTREAATKTNSPMIKNN